MNTLELAATANPWRHRHPGEKALLCGALLLAAVALPPWPGALVVLAVVLSVAIGPARVPPRVLVRALRGPGAFVALGTLPVLLTVSTAGIGWAPDGPRTAGELLARALAGLSATVLFAATTPLSEVLPRLERLGVPAAVVQVAVLVYRMSATLGGTARAVHAAQAARLGHRNRRALLRATAGQAATLFVLSLQRARRLQDGLALRAETGSMDVLVEHRRLSVPFVVASTGLVSAVLVAGLVL